MFVCPSCARTFQVAGFCTEDGSVLGDTTGDPLLGQDVGSYRLVQRLGSGAMGTVYLGVHPGIGSRVAVKVLNPGAAATPTLVERFFAEAKAVNVVRHGSIVNVLDLAMLPDGRPYIVMEYLDGAPLSAHFAAHQPYPLGTLARFGVEVLGALAAAHSLGITHRDLKPDNVFVTSLGHVKVLDFGIAKLRPEHGGGSDGTRTGALLGTPQYMSPEQAAGQPVDARSDLYSLGVILFEGATGRRPFAADALFELLRQQIQDPPPPPRSLRPELPPELEAVILRALEKDRARRFQSAAELAEALAAAAAGLPDAPAPSSSELARTQRSGVEPASVAPLPATVSAATIGNTSVTLPAPRSGSLGIVLGIGAGVVALLALGVGIATLVAVLRAGPPAARDEPEPKKPGKHHDVVGYLPKARQEARKLLPDAELYNLAATSPERDGTVDLADPNRAVTYNFRSPSASAGSETRKCLVNVSVSAWGTFAAAVEDKSCEQPIIERPPCSLSRVTRTLPAGRALSSVVYQNANGSWQWVLVSGSSVRVEVDDC